ncbi:hypothetical protein BP6252_05910 [Coleophoma cylindrospora]|uniref:Zn(2)-C6 fungal-type domain-containing protein n=1 Tax=Coleophoma cylindrospora TaxID=1849047 RepID=A0A3D8RLD9_9HELO|nr:hypothetical protein BP6252_05910 [Coleophoma cylindrospora]
MLPSTPLDPVPPNSKRSACDRCRSQKLRCPPRENGSQACMRCTRAGVQCVTIHSKPLGRPAAVLAPQPNPRPAGEAGSKGIQNTSRAAQAPTAPSVHPPTLETPLSSSWPWLVQEGSELDFLPSQDGMPPSTPEDFLNRISSQASLSDASVFSDALRNEERVGPRWEDKDDLFSLHLPSDLAMDGRMDWMDALEEYPQPKDHLVYQRSIQSIVSDFECDPRLSRLSVHLSRQIQLCLARPQPSYTTIMGTSFLEDPRDGKDSDGMLNSNLFGDMLCSTSEFLAIIQSYGVVESSSVSSEDRPQTTYKLRPPLGVINVLNLLASYLQIIAICDNLFLRLHERLCAASQSPVSGLQTLPGLRLAGFPVQQGNLQTKLLIHAIQHQFETIEKILGLPPEFRVSDRREAYMGLLDDERAQSLLKATMNEKLINGAHGIDTQGPMNRVWGLRALVSLRANIEKVRLFLDN